MEQANVAYSMTMKCDDNGGDFIALYDKVGNLLNIIPANNNFCCNIYTFKTTTAENVSFDKIQAVEKIDKLIIAHDILVDQNKELENKMLNAAEILNNTKLPPIKTSNNIEINHSECSIAVVINYFYDYVNNNIQYSDFENYIESHTDYEINEKYLFKGYSKYDTNEIIMFEAIGLIPYIKQFDNIQYGNLVKETTIKMINAEVAYSMTIDCNDNGGNFIALYDIAGNLLNVIPANSDFNDYITTF